MTKISIFFNVTVLFTIIKFLRKLKNFKTIPLDESEEVTKQPQNPKKQHHFYLIVYVSFWPVGHNSS